LVHGDGHRDHVAHRNGIAYWGKKGELINNNEINLSPELIHTLTILGGDIYLAILRFGEIHGHVLMSIDIGETLNRLNGGTAFALVELYQIMIKLDIVYIWISKWTHRGNTLDLGSGSIRQCDDRVIGIHLDQRHGAIGIL